MIVTFATVNYSRWLDLLLRSVRYSNPNMIVNAYLIGWDNDPRNSISKEDFKKEHLNCNFFDIPITDNTIKKFSRMPGIVLEEKVMPTLVYFKTLIILAEALKGENIIFADADTIFLKDISGILEKLNKYDALFTVRPHKENEGMKIYAGLMGFASRANVIEYLIRALDICSSSIPAWGEQYALWKAIRDDMKVCPLLDSEHSIDRNTESCILASKKMNVKMLDTKFISNDDKYEAMKKVLEEKMGVK